MPRLEDGSIELPGVDGFLAPVEGNWSFNPQLSYHFGRLLGSWTFTRRTDPVSTKVYINLVVLFRMLLFYGDLQHTPPFWKRVRSDWGTKSKASVGHIAVLVNYFTDARLRSIETQDHRPETLLMRLAARWAELRGGAGPANVGKSEWDSRKAAWEALRDTAFERLLDPLQPLCLSSLDRIRPWTSEQLQPPRGPQHPAAPRGDYYAQREGRLLPTLAERQPSGPQATVPARQVGSYGRDHVASRPQQSRGQGWAPGLSPPPVTSETPRPAAVFAPKRPAPSTPSNPRVKRSCATGFDGLNAGPAPRPPATARLPHPQLGPPFRPADYQAEERELPFARRGSSRERDMSGCQDQFENLCIKTDPEVKRMKGLGQVDAPAALKSIPRPQHVRHDGGGEGVEAAVAMDPRNPGEDRIRQLEQRIEYLEGRLGDEISYSHSLGALLNDANEQNAATFQDIWATFAAIRGKP